jgi:hypothetical protein
MLKVAVFELPLKKPAKTVIWMSESAIHKLSQLKKRKREEYIHFLAKLERWAICGFSLAEVAGDVKGYGRGVFRYGIRESLHRIIGFYEQDRKSSFIGISFYTKSGQKRGHEGDRLTDFVARVKQYGEWEKKTGFPGGLG